MNKTIPNYLVYTQLTAFIVVYAVWILPETTALRNIALTIGAVASLYPIYLFRSSILSKNAIPIWMIMSLFMWVIFHYFYMGKDHEKQLEELNSIWKYTFILSIFGLGLGITLIQTKLKKINNIFFIGLLMPTCIFLIKTIIIFLETKYNYELPQYLKIPKNSTDFYIQKMDYIFFCTPAFIYSLVNIYINITKKYKNKKLTFIYILTVISTIYLFYYIETKNGILFSLLSIIIFMMISLSRLKIFIPILILIIVTPFYVNHFSQNSTWKNILYDVALSIQTEKYQEWKDPDISIVHIKNNLNNSVQMTTYHRVAWTVEGIKLVPENLGGYGLVEDSFRYIAIKKWKDANRKLNHTHCGWLDLVLGIGVPGVIIILGSLILIIKHCNLLINKICRSNLPYFYYANSFGIIFIGLTNEIAAKSVIPILIFWIALMSVMKLNFDTKNKIL